MSVANSGTIIRTSRTKSILTRAGFILLILAIPFAIAACGNNNNNDDNPAPAANITDGGGDGGGGDQNKTVASTAIIFPASYLDGGSDTNGLNPINIRIDGDGSLESSRVLPAVVSPANSTPEDVGVYSAPNVDSTEVTSKLVGQNIVFSRTSAGVTVSSAGNLIVRTIVGNNVTTIIKAKLVDNADWIDFDSVTVHLIGADGVGSVGTKVSVATTAELANADVNEIPIADMAGDQNKLRVFYNKGTTSVDASNPDVYLTNSNTAAFSTNLVFAGNEGVGKGWYLIVLPKSNSVDETATITLKSVEGDKLAMFKVKSVMPSTMLSADLPSGYITETAALSHRLDATNKTKPVFSDIDVHVPAAASTSATTIPLAAITDGESIDALTLVLYNESSTTIMPGNIDVSFNKTTKLVSFDFKDATPAAGNFKDYYTLKLVLDKNKFTRVGIIPVLNDDWKAITSIDLVQAKDRKRASAVGQGDNGDKTVAPASSAATEGAANVVNINFYKAGDTGKQSPTTPNGDLKNEPGEVDITNKFLVRFNDMDINEMDSNNNPGVKVVVSGADAGSFTYDLFQIADHSYWLNIAASAIGKSATFTVTSIEDNTKVAVLKVASVEYVKPITQ